jgi:hypothetical protein
MINRRTLFVALFAIASCGHTLGATTPTATTTSTPTTVVLGFAATSITTPTSTTSASIDPIRARSASPPLDPYWACKAISRDATDLYCITVSHDPRSFVAEIAFAPDAHLTADAPFSARFSGDARAFEPPSIHEQDLAPAPRVVRAVSHVRRDSPAMSRVNVTLDFYVCTPKRCIHAQKSWQFDDP